MNLAQHRKAAGLTQTELGKVIGRTKETVRQYEANPKKLTVERLEDYANACNVTVADLMGFDGQAQEKLKNVHDLLSVDTGPLWVTDD